MLFPSTFVKAAQIFDYYGLDTFEVKDIIDRLPYHGHRSVVVWELLLIHR